MLLLNANFLVVQTIFGHPLRDKTIFYPGDIAEWVDESFIGGHQLYRICYGLAEEKWIAPSKSTTPPPRQPFAAGRPPTQFYVRTQKGRNEYSKLVLRLKVLGIVLR